MKEKLTLRRILAYLGGLMILALGIAGSVRSDLGSSPVSSVPYAFNLTTGLEFGTATFLYQALLVVGQLIILKREFSPWTLLQLISGFIFGYFNSFALWIFKLFPAPRMMVFRLCFTAIGFVVGGFGVWLYSTSDVLNMPSEGFVMALSKKIKRPFHQCKIIFDVSSVVLALAICLIFLRKTGSVGIGTVIIAILLGTMVGIYERFFGKALRGFLKVPEKNR